MSKHCKIMQRIKAFYESRSRTFLTRRVPVIMRLDGKAFHTYTRGLDKPFDEGLIEDMQETAKYLCKNIQGAKCAYVQSDEISILITDYDKLETDAWFDYNVQKMTSISASLATGKFLIERIKRVTNQTQDGDWINGYLDSVTLANFDSRVFNIPKEEVSNYFLARQKDAVKNSIYMLAQSLYSHKELDKKNSNELQEMTFQKGHNWNDLHFSKKRGSFIVKNTYLNDWLVDDFERALAYPNLLKEEVMAYTENGVWLDQDGLPLKEKTFRTKWEVVETLFTFTNSNFQQWL